MAKRIVAIGGVPCTGKTTLLKTILDKVDPKKTFKFGLVRGYLKDNVAILGIYNKKEVFGGTDKLSMAVQKDYEKFITNLDCDILFEGDRLFTEKNLLHIQENYEHKLIVLDLDKETLEQRHIERNDTQSDKFKKSRHTKIQNMLNNKRLKPDLKVIQIKDKQKAGIIADEVIKFLF